MRIFYHLSHYISHKEAGLAYIQALKDLNVEVETDYRNLHLCNLAILHDDPFQIKELIARIPALVTIPKIAYVVFEGSTLPKEYLGYLDKIENIWTCSHFSKQIFSPYFPNTSVIPHIVERKKVSPSDMAYAKEKMQYDGKTFIFFSIIDALNPRKNLPALLAAFSSFQKQSSTPVSLVLKQYRANVDLSHIKGVISIFEDLTPEQVGALHITSNAYISTHHAEGWGLGLSEAMSYGKPVIATGYSGNMEFMNNRNSFPIPFVMNSVPKEMTEKIPLFTSDMQWGTIDNAALIDTMKKVAAGRYDNFLLQNAALITKQFSSKKIGALMIEKIKSIPKNTL